MSPKIIHHGPIKLWTQHLGNPNDPAVLLISGAGAPAMFWTDIVINQLIAAHYCVIRFDHRDQGLSSAISYEMHPYTVLDLAQDAIAILDAYGIKKAHIVGHSMGGLIAQLIAINYPDRVLSMTSISVGTVGNLGTPPQEVMDVLLENKPTQNFKESLAGYMKSWRILNGDYTLDEHMATAYTYDLYKRSQHPVGVAWNHIKAQEKFGNIANQLKNIHVPAFFIHGEKDPLIPLAAGIATAHTVPHAYLAIIPGMGHMMFNQELEDTVARLLIQNFKSIEDKDTKRN